jgi:hypothetical protein
MLINILVDPFRFLEAFVNIAVLWQRDGHSEAHFRGCFLNAHCLVTASQVTVCLQPGLP